MFVLQKQGCFHFFCNNFSKCSKTKQKYYHPLSQYIQYQQNAESTHIHIYTWRKTCCPPLGLDLDINETEKKKVDESNKTRSRVVKTNGPCSNVAATAVCNAHFYLHQALQKTQWNTSAVGLESSQKNSVWINHQARQSVLIFPPFCTLGGDLADTVNM